MYRFFLVPSFFILLLSMDDLGGIPLNINGDGMGDSLISVVYGNPDIPNDEPLEVNCHIPNLVVFSDKSRIGGGSIESGGGHPYPFNGNEEVNSHHFYLGVVAHLTSFIRYHEEMKMTVVSQNEARVRRFSETFVAASGMEHTKDQMKEHILFRSNNPTSDCNSDPLPHTSQKKELKM